MIYSLSCKLYKTQVLINQHTKIAAITTTNFAFIKSRIYQQVYVQFEVDRNLATLIITTRFAFLLMFYCFNPDATGSVKGHVLTKFQVLDSSGCGFFLVSSIKKIQKFTTEQYQTLSALHLLGSKGCITFDFMFCVRRTSFKWY